MRGHRAIFLAFLVACFVVFHQPSVVLAGRLLQQSDALSNSNGCLATIPKCEPGACATRNIMGVARWVCLRCLANYEPVVDSSGQDNTIQCVCPRGFYEQSPNATSCSRCEVNNFCPGGAKVETPTSRGTRVSCGSNLVTRNTGARSQLDCVAPSGYALTSPNVATPCGRSEYAPMYNRLAKCLRCQSGLEEALNSNLTNSQRASKRAACKVPPGRYVSQGLVRWCAQGFYRENYVVFDAAVAQKCVPCNPGITTAGAGSGLAADCNRVLPGYGIKHLFNVTGPEGIPALLQSSDGLPNATLCSIGFYSSAGYCIACPAGTVTRTLGAKAIEECMVPPGYFLQSGSMTLCPAGTYRANWAMFSAPQASNCTACGVGISSEPRDLDENPLAASDSLVRATSFSCFIEAGQGMIAAGKNTFAAWNCPINTYGAAGKVYGLTAAPCKPCPRNMITDGLIKVNNSDACINPDGYGYATEGASRCAPGFYSAKGSRKPCQQCPSGRTTLDLASGQRVFTDCFVTPGFGVVSSQGSSSDGTGFLADTTGLTAEQAAVLPVLECPIGYWGAGSTVNSTCLKCHEGSTTLETSSTSVEQCSVCIPGYGKQGSDLCTPCNFGSYHPGGDTVCTQCPSARFYAPVDGDGPTWESAGTTLFKGSIGVEFCLPKESQLSPDAGQAYFSVDVQPVLTTTLPASSLGDCIAMCPQDSCCMIQYETGSGSGVCKHSALPWDPVSAGGVKLKYKLPPGTLTSASSINTNKTDSSRKQVRAKMMASGFYARCSVADDKVSAWMKAGVPLDSETAQTFKWGTAPVWDLNKSEADCQRTCDNSVICWGFLYDSSSQSCLYRGGEDALSTRSFFVLPNMTMDGSGTGGVAASPSPVPAAPGGGVASSPSPAPVASPSPTPLPSPSPSPVASPSPTPLPSPSPSPVASPSPTPLPSPSPVASPSPTPLPSPSPSPVASPSPTPLPSPSPTPVTSPSPTPLPSPSPTPVASPSPTPLPSPSPSPVASPSPTPLPSPSPSPVASPSPVPLSPSPAPSQSGGGIAFLPSPSPAAQPISSPSPAAAVPPSPSPKPASPSPSPSPSPLPSPSPTPSPSPSPRPSPSPSPTPPPSPSPSPTPSPSPSPSPSSSPPPSPSPSPSPSPTPSFPNSFFPTAGAEVFTTVTTPVTLDKCLSYCPADCCIVQYDRTTGWCRFGQWGAEDTSSNGLGKGYRVTLKKTDVPQTVGQLKSATKFERCSISDSMVAYWSQAGTNLDPWTATKEITTAVWVPSSNEDDCRKTCGDSSACWGFLYFADNKSCLYRGGQDSGTVLTYLL